MSSLYYLFLGFLTPAHVLPETRHLAPVGTRPCPTGDAGVWHRWHPPMSHRRFGVCRAFVVVRVSRCCEHLEPPEEE